MIEIEIERELERNGLRERERYSFRGIKRAVLDLKTAQHYNIANHKPK